MSAAPLGDDSVAAGWHHPYFTAMPVPDQHSFFHTTPWPRGVPAVKFHEMTFPELRAVRRDAVVVLAPIAACEQHSHHLATFTDTVLVTGVAEGVESTLPGEVLLLPTL